MRLDPCVGIWLERDDDPAVADLSILAGRPERHTLAIPRLGHNALGHPVREQQVFERSLGGRILQLDVRPFDRYPDIYGIRALQSCRARQYPTLAPAELVSTMRAAQR